MRAFHTLRNLMHTPKAVPEVPEPAEGAAADVAAGEGGGYEMMHPNPPPPNPRGTKTRTKSLALILKIDVGQIVHLYSRPTSLVSTCVRTVSNTLLVHAKAHGVN